MDAPLSTIALEVVDAGEYVSGHEVLVFVDGVDITRRGAGMGMSPFDLLIPRNRLVAGPQPIRIRIARCSCGEADANVTDVIVTRTGDTVTWSWRRIVPMDHDVTFATEAYDEAVRAVGEDRTWERQDDTVTRAVLVGLDRDEALRETLSGSGLAVGWVQTDEGEVTVSLDADGVGESDRDYQVLVRFAVRGSDPADVAARVRHHLAQPPSQWAATFIVCRPGLVPPRPPMAGPAWGPEFPRRGR